jgi:hypothetical protein
MTRRAELRQLAAAATPGPWFRQWQLISGPDQGGLDIGGLIAEVYPPTEDDERDAAYIAALDPTTVTLLLDIADAAAAVEKAWSASQPNESSGPLNPLRVALDALEREVAG